MNRKLVIPVGVLMAFWVGPGSIKTTITSFVGPFLAPVWTLLAPNLLKLFQPILVFISNSIAPLWAFATGFYGKMGILVTKSPVYNIMKVYYGQISAIVGTQEGKFWASSVGKIVGTNYTLIRGHAIKIGTLVYNNVLLVWTKCLILVRNGFIQAYNMVDPIIQEMQEAVNVYWNKMVLNIQGVLNPVLTKLGLQYNNLRKVLPAGIQNFTPEWSTLLIVLQYTIIAIVLLVVLDKARRMVYRKTKTGGIDKKQKPKALDSIKSSTAVVASGLASPAKKDFPKTPGAGSHSGQTSSPKPFHLRIGSSCGSGNSTTVQPPAMMGSPSDTPTSSKVKVGSPSAISALSPSNMANSAMGFFGLGNTSIENKNKNNNDNEVKSNTVSMDAPMGLASSQSSTHRAQSSSSAIQKSGSLNPQDSIGSKNEKLSSKPDDFHHVAPPGRGCYLVYDERDGTLVTKYSDTPVYGMGTMAYAEPGKELLKKFQKGKIQVHTKGQSRIAHGWVSFLRESILTNHCTRILLFEHGFPHLSMKIHWLKRKTRAPNGGYDRYEILPGEAWYLDPAEVKLVGVVPFSCRDFPGAKMELDDFNQCCRIVGGASGDMKQFHLPSLSSMSLGKGFFGVNTSPATKKKVSGSFITEIMPENQKRGSPQKL